jgi:alpha-glucosidase
MTPKRTFARQISIQACLLLCAVSAFSQTPKISRLAEGYHCSEGDKQLDVTAFSTNVLRISIRLQTERDARTPVLVPGLHETPAEGLAVRPTLSGGEIQTRALKAKFDCAAQTLDVTDNAGEKLLGLSALWTNALQRMLLIHRAAMDPMYGMTGINRNVPGATLDHPAGAAVSAGSQGKGGAPFFFTRKFGILVDSVDGNFAVNGVDVSFEQDSRKEIEAFILVGPPITTISGLADLTGHAPMPPRWTLGFLNSQWGIDEAELKTIVSHYRSSHIPLDGFIIDYDWKAWGEDDYGEWRWNSSSATGNPHPNKFPNGASGALARELGSEGVHLAGILKPRILLYKEGTTDYLQPAAYAEAHHFWYPGLGTMMDYTTKRPTANLDFSIPAEREWFWKHLEPAFDTGMVAWWNDEADEVSLANKTDVPMDSLEFFNMGRSLYDGQRSHSNTRVWSLNRNYYLGAQRYGYAEWSGDIKSGAVSMAQQPIRMLATLNMGEPHWSMDTGGFRGTPTSEEYARWMEFAAFTPISRVHGSLNQKRQPWVYGPVAEAASAHAMRLRYSLLPYIYSAERSSYETGIGIARPLEWVYPNDVVAAAQTNEWMFGDALLVAPVLDLKAATRKVYLPAGNWIDYVSGKVSPGAQSVELPTDAKTWMDIPLFVREGSMIATEEAGDSLDAMHASELTVDVFPSPSGSASWTMYDDDGNTYNYEKGAYFKQVLSATFEGKSLVIATAAAQGTFVTGVHSYLFRIHSVKASALRFDSKSIPAEKTLAKTVGDTPSWSALHDRFGEGIELRVRSGRALKIELPGVILARP